MNEYGSLNHAKCECKYHVVFIPKYRRKALYRSLRKHLRHLFREWAQAEGMRDWGGAPDGRSCAYAGLDSAEVLGIAGAGVGELKVDGGEMHGPMLSSGRARRVTLQWAFANCQATSRTGGVSFSGWTTMRS